MDYLIRQAFLHVEVIGPHVAEGHYDLVGPNGEIILPQVWETVIEPDWTISMHMWPIPEPPPPPPPPEAPPAGADAAVVEVPPKDGEGEAPPAPPPPPAPKKTKKQSASRPLLAWAAGKSKNQKSLKLRRKPEDSGPLTLFMGAIDSVSVTMAWAKTPHIVPIRPIPRSPAQRTNPQIQHPSNFSIRKSEEGGSEQQIVFAPRRRGASASSRPRIVQGDSYCYGSGPVPTVTMMTGEGEEERVFGKSGQGQHRRSYSQQQQQQIAPVGRRSGGVDYAASSPRQSNVSFRSTREKIVVVDEMGRRRESGFY
ncbi:MAG: hypothetical protein Q9182_000662 [Xanthomendoza sp. 2 TL-2023]